MRSTEVRYHKSNEQIDDECGSVKPLTVGYHRFSMLERVLVVIIGVIFVVALILGILYASEKGNTKAKSERDNEDKICLTADCVTVSSDVLKSIDWTTNPCDDFYKFSCGKWLEDHEIPGSQTSFGQFAKLSQENSNFIKAKLESKEALKRYKGNEAVSKALIDYFSCMEAEKRKDGSGLQSAYNLIKQYGSWNISDPDWSSSNWTIMSSVISIHQNLSLSPLFITKVWEDLRNSSNYIATVAQTGSRLISRESYLTNTSHHLKIRSAYKDLMQTVISKLANTTKTDPDILIQVEGIYEFERLLAEISMPLEQARKTEENYKKVSIKELQEYAGRTFNWLDYFQRLFQDIDVEITEKSVIAVTQLDYLRNMSAILGKTNDVVLGNYLMWKVISGMSAFLGKAIKDDFQAYFKRIYGTVKVTPRWKFCLTSTQLNLGLPLSMLYIGEKFGESQMKQVEEMVSGIRDVFIDNLQNINWMDQKTKTVALKKARTIKQNIGYPKILLNQEKLNKQYEELKIDEKDYFANVLRKRKFTGKKNLERILQPVDKSEWSLDPDTTNAYYSPTENKIVFPAGVLQSPFYDASRPKSLNYGAIGMVIGHELTHSFDNRGRRYDEHGNLADWWSHLSVKEFEKRAECLKKKYSGYTFHNLKINGQNTLDENIADNGGIKQAFQAYKRWTKIHGNEPRLPGLNMTNHQLFFIGFSQVWCTKYRESVIQVVVEKGSHAPGWIRVLGSLSNFPEFSKAFNCPSGSRMNPPKKCNVW